MKSITRTGFWSDICVLPSGRFAHVVSDRGAVAAYEGVEQKPPLWRQTLATDLLRFLRCASAPDGSIAAIGQAADGRAWLVRPGSAQMLDVAAGVIADNAVSRKFSLTTAPVLIALLTQLLVGEALAEREVAEVRRAHREMLLILFARRGN